MILRRPKKSTLVRQSLPVLILLTCALVAAQERSAQKSESEPITGKADRRVSSAETLVTGDRESLQAAVADAAGGTLKFYFTPRPPLQGRRRADADRQEQLISAPVRRDQLSMIATARVQPADARSIFTGKQDTMKPVAGKSSRLCSFSMWQ